MLGLDPTLGNLSGETLSEGTGARTHQFLLLCPWLVIIPRIVGSIGQLTHGSFHF
jgi:hypothetical protein